MKCPNCGHQNLAGSAFCDDCGFDLYPAPPPPICPQCGTLVAQPGAAFCDNCGTQLGAVGPGGSTDQPKISTQMTTAPMRMRLVVAANGVQLPLAGKQEFLIGREDPIGNVFPDADLGPHGGDAGGVSRRHAKILVHGNQVLIEDLNSTNGTWVNKQKVQAGQPIPLTDGSDIRLGKVVLTFQMS